MLIKNYFFYYSEKKFLLYKIILLLFSTSLIILFLNAFSYGIFTMTKNNIISGYGDIYIQLNKKLNKKLFFKKNIKSILSKNQYIESCDIYGITNALLIIENRYVPIYLISYLEMPSKKKINTLNNSFYCGEVLYNKYNFFDKKKIVIITRENKKEKTLYFDSLSISFYDKYNFGWDDWNEKAIMMPVEKVENYFEIATIEYINVYVKDKKNINEVMIWIKNILKNEINYINFGIAVLPEFNKFIVLLNMISQIISFLILFFSYFLLLILINLYFYENKNDFFFLILTGIKEIYIKSSIFIFFFILGIISLFGGFVCGYFVIKSINFFSCYLIPMELNNYFSCIINLNFLYYYSLIYLILLLFAVAFYYRKYIFNR